MQAHKWVSNSVKVFERIPTEKKASEVHIVSDGLVDFFTFKANPPERDFLLTKRNFPKNIAELFDPVGSLAPLIISAITYFKRCGWPG